MFYDRAKIYVRSGDGGDGMISFRREKFVPLGGPDGGDGGNGGSIIIVTNPNLNSLVRFHRKNHFRAEHGKHGNPKRKTGASGGNEILEVPVGTIIQTADTNQLLVDLSAPGQQAILLKGGRGGRGNIRFANSRNQAPRLADRGEPGGELWLELELKLIADVGIIGVPNAGKSTLLSSVSAAKPKIADYAFTTIQPNLGVVTIDEYVNFVMADIPGLIEGAAQGAGLGHDFLRHIERTRVLIHVLDGSATDPLEDWAMINQELSLYDISLEGKPQLVVLNKMDLPDANAWEPIIEEEIVKRGLPFCAISAVTGQGVHDMLYRVKQLLDDAPPQEIVIDQEPIIVPPDDEMFSIEREGNAWRVRGRKIERVAAMTYFEFDTTLVRFQHILEGMGVSKALEEAGVREGDIVIIGKHELEWGE